MAEPMLIKRIQSFVAEHALLHVGDHVLVAVSGGADSTALLHVLHTLSEPLGIRLTVCHLNHAIRGPAAAADAAFVRQLAGALCLPIIIGRKNVPRLAREKGISMEMAARDARYAFFVRTARRVGAGTIVTGHTRDDQAETVLLKLLRGAGPRGLSGIARDRSIGDLRVVRPLLGVSRQEIVSFLRADGRTWREDASNRDVAILRNRVRHELMPLLETRINPALRETLARTADVMGQEDEWLDGLAERRLAAVRADDGALELESLDKCLPAERRRVLLGWLVQGGVEPEAIDFATLHRVASLAASRRGSRDTDVAGGWTARRRYGRLCLIRKEAPAAFRQVVTVPGETLLPDPGLRVVVNVGQGVVKPRSAIGILPARCSLRIERLGRRRLVVRSWKPGDRMQPLALGGSRKLQDIFVDAKLPSDARRRVPLLACGATIVWVPGYRIAEGWQVEDANADALQICVERI